MASKRVQRHEREYRQTGAGRAVGVGEVESVEGGQQVETEATRRWERAKAAYEAVVAGGASASEAYEAAREAYEG